MLQLLAVCLPGLALTAREMHLTCAATDGLPPHASAQHCLPAPLMPPPAVCAPGYGGSSASECAAGATSGAKLCKDGTYGSPSRTGSDTACAACPTGRRFSYTYTSDEVFVPGATSRHGAISVDDCIADFSQTIDGASYLPLTLGATFAIAADVVSLRGCVDACRADAGCTAATFTYYDDSTDSETACTCGSPSLPATLARE
jgi:hypothetical protein